MKSILGLPAVRMTWLVLGLLFGTASSSQEATEKGNIWAEVSAKAKAAGDRKALWRELKALKPEELLLCGEQFCVAEKPNVPDLIFTTNAILSYHQKATSYGETANVVGQIIRTSKTEKWVHGALEWIESNDHVKEIPPEGMAAIGDGMLAALSNKDCPLPILQSVAKKAGSFDTYGALSSEYRNRLRRAVQKLATDHPDNAVKKRAKRTLKAMARADEEIRQ